MLFATDTEMSLCPALEDIHGAVVGNGRLQGPPPGGGQVIDHSVDRTICSQMKRR